MVDFILSLIKSILLLLQRRAEERRAMRAKLIDEFKNASGKLCSVIGKGSETIRTIQDCLAKQESRPSSPDYAILRDCSQTLTAFNDAQTDFFKVIDSLFLKNRDPQAYENQKYNLVLLLEEYAHDIQDTTYVAKLSQGIESSYEKNNSALLRNIVSLFSSPQDSIGNIISLRFKNNAPRDYYSDSQRICNHFAEMTKLPIRNEYKILVSPFKAGFGDPEQMYRLGLLFLQQGNRKDAGLWLEKAVEKGHLEAHLTLGKLLLKEGKNEAGVILLQNASNRGHEVSTLELGKYYREQKVFQKAIDCFSRLRDSRRDAKFYLAQACISLENYKEGIELFAELVGVKDAVLDIYSAASMYHIVETVNNRIKDRSIDTSRIMDFYERVENSITCEDDTMLPYLQIYIPLQKAMFLADNHRYNQAYVIYNELVKRNSPAAECELGKLYERGDGVPRDPQLAQYYYRLSAGKNYPRAYAELGRGFIGMASNNEYAYNYLKTASSYNIRNSYYYLTVFFGLGYAARIGKGTIMDGVEYEKRYHTTTSRYKYVSLLDHSIKESTLVEDFIDMSANVGNSLYWWLSKENIPDFDQMTQEAEEINSVVSRKRFMAFPFSDGSDESTWKTDGVNPHST